MKTPLYTDRLTNVHRKVSERLDSLGARIQPVKPEPLPFDAYRQEAEARAAVDPAFAQEYQRALAQYRALGGA